MAILLQETMNHAIVFFFPWPRIPVCRSVCLKQNNLSCCFPLFYVSEDHGISLLWHYVPYHDSGPRRRNSWKRESIGLMPISIALSKRTYCSKHCTSFPLAGYKTCWSFWLYLSGVSRARAEPVYLLCVPVRQRISGKWCDCCLCAPGLSGARASQNCYQWKKKRASRNRFLLFKAAVGKQKQIVMVIFKPRYFLEFKESSHVIRAFFKR